MGSGSVAAAAKRLNRRFVRCDESVKGIADKGLRRAG